MARAARIMSRYPKDRFKIKCVVCDGVFEVIKSRLLVAKFCSRECRGKHSRLSSDVHNCVLCGCIIEELSAHREQARRHGTDRFFCSRECFYSLNLKDHPIGTRRECARTSYVSIKIHRDKWVTEHRMIAEGEIGRKLKYDSEPIIHIDGNHANNSVDNLYICRDKGECNTILKSFNIPYPIHSNLKTYNSKVN